MIAGNELVMLQKMLVSDFQGKYVKKKDLKNWLIDFQEKRRKFVKATGEDLILAALGAGIKIQDVPKNYAKEEISCYQKKFKDVSDEELISLYEVDFLSAFRIGAMFQVNAQTVLKRLRGLGREIRTYENQISTRVKESTKTGVVNNLYEILKKKDISRNKLAELSGVSYTYIRSLCEDRVLKIDLDLLGKICKALNCQVGEILIYKEKGAC